jgi:hypothetical protein
MRRVVRALILSTGTLALISNAASAATLEVTQPGVLITRSGGALETAPLGSVTINPGDTVTLAQGAAARVTFSGPGGGSCFVAVPAGTSFSVPNATPCTPTTQSASNTLVQNPVLFGVGVAAIAGGAVVLGNASSKPASP